MNNRIQIFNNAELGLQVRTILNEDGSISVNAEDTAIGFGWIQNQTKNGKQYTSVRWETLNGYCNDLGFPNLLGKEDYIPESLYYLLGMKANNERAQKYQKWLAMEVLPMLRKTGSYQMPKKERQDNSKKISLASVNKAVSNIDRIFSRAGVDNLYIAAEAKRLYTEAGYDIKIPLITDKETMPKLYDCTEIASELGILSSSGNPHNKAVSAILSKLDIAEDEIVMTAFSRNGHEDVTTQYKPSVYVKVQKWLEDNSYPVKIPYTDSKGNYKTYSVVYREVA